MVSGLRKMRWEAPAFRLAKELNKPLLVLGTRSTPLCRQARDSLAQMAPQNFVALEVAADEHRDVDLALQSFVRLVNNGQCSWPFHVVLSPQTFRPYLCATSLAPNTLPKFLESARETWDTLPVEAESVGTQAVQALEDPGILPEIDPSFDIVAHAELQYAALADQMPRFVMGASLAKFGSETRGKLLHEIAASGIVDHLNGGVFRCALSRDWHLPVLHKDIDDQATLLMAACAQLRTCPQDKLDPEIVKLVTGLCQQIKAMLAGGPVAKVLWTYAEFQAALGDLNLIERDIAASYWGVNEIGNINDDLQASSKPVLGDLFAQNVLSRHGDVAEVAKTFGVDPAKVEHIAEVSRLALAAAQPGQAPPVPLSVAQRGLVLSAVAQASEFTAAELPVQLARELAESLVAPTHPLSTCSDFAMRIRGVLDYNRHIDADPKWLNLATEWQDQQNTLFLDDSYFFGLPSEHVDDHPIRFINPRFWEDGSVPNYQGVSAANLTDLAADRPDFADLAHHIRKVGLAKAQQSPLAYLSYV